MKPSADSSPPFTPRNIIVRMPNWIGDLVMATPILADLRAAYPDARITAMCRAPICELLKEDGHIDELFCFSRVSGFSRHAERRNIMEKLRSGSYDLGILLTHSFSSAWLFWRARIPYRLGYDGNGRSLLLTKSLPLPVTLEEQHLVTTYKMLLAPLGIPVSKTHPCLYLTEQEKEAAGELLYRHQIPRGATLVGINPGATYGSAKCWIPDRFREVTQLLLRDPNLYFVYFGDLSMLSLVKEICRDLPSRVVNLAGLTSLRQLASLICQCSVLLTNDSGPMHIADALNVPVVALFGSTSPIVTGPYRARSVIQKSVACSPCYQRRCPIDFRCMTSIQTDEVYREILHVLRSGALKVIR